MKLLNGEKYKFNDQSDYECAKDALSIEGISSQFSFAFMNMKWFVTANRKTAHISRYILDRLLSASRLVHQLASRLVRCMTFSTPSDSAHLQH